MKCARGQRERVRGWDFGGEMRGRRARGVEFPAAEREKRTMARETRLRRREVRRQVSGYPTAVPRSFQLTNQNVFCTFAPRKIIFLLATTKKNTVSKQKKESYIDHATAK